MDEPIITTYGDSAKRLAQFFCTGISPNQVIAISKRHFKLVADTDKYIIIEEGGFDAQST